MGSFERVIAAEAFWFGSPPSIFCGPTQPPCKKYPFLYTEGKTSPRSPWFSSDYPCAVLCIIISLVLEGERWVVSFWRVFVQKFFLFPPECNCGGRTCDSQTGECLADSPAVSTGTDCPTISKKTVRGTSRLRCLQILSEELGPPVGWALGPRSHGALKHEAQPLGVWVFKRVLSCLTEHRRMPSSVVQTECLGTTCGAVRKYQQSHFYRR